MIGPVVDFANVDSIHRKRIIAFVNHFIINTASFLNRLSQTVEGKLLQVDHRLQKLEASVILLESKLSSIPGLESSVPVASVVILQECIAETTPQKPVEETEKEVAAETVEEAVKPEKSLDESLLKYVKMLQVGVPMPAVKLKMQQDGISNDQQNLVLAQ